MFSFHVGSLKYGIPPLYSLDLYWANPAADGIFSFHVGSLK
jgi:hypothetical protein